MSHIVTKPPVRRARQERVKRLAQEICERLAEEKFTQIAERILAQAAKPSPGEDAKRAWNEARDVLRIHGEDLENGLLDTMLEFATTLAETGSEALYKTADGVVNLEAPSRLGTYAMVRILRKIRRKELTLPNRSIAAE